jgi:16S rRNA (guanine(966)-N(2))-methyltransferase RsmD
MRVISGTAKGRRLASFRGEGIRPTSDRVKEALFNIIVSNFGPLDGKKVLDLFSGTGNLGVEALSRGAGRAVFVDESQKSVNIIKKNIEICGLADRSEALRSSVETAIRLLSKKGGIFNLVFLDPPYEKGLVEKTLEDVVKEGIVEDGAVVIAEHSLRERPSDEYDGLTLIDRRKYGDTEISFYKFEILSTKSKTNPNSKIQISKI